MREFRTPIIADPQQIYISALPLCPQSTLLSKTFRSCYGGTLKIKFGAEKNWSRCLATFEGHGNEIDTIAISPDGSRIFSASQDDVRIWDINTGSSSQVFNLQFRQCHANDPRNKKKCCTAAEYSPDGDQIIVANSERIYLLAAHTGTVIWELSVDRHLITLAFSRNGGPIFFGSYRQKFAHDGSRSQSFQYFVSAILLTTDQTNLRFAVDHHIMDTPPFLNGHLSSMALSSSNNKIVASLPDHMLKVWDTQTGNVLLPALQGHTNPLADVAFASDDSMIVSCALDDPIFVWNAETGSLICVLGKYERTWNMFISPDTSQIVAVEFGPSLRAWDWKKGTTIGAPVMVENMDWAAFMPSGRQLIVGLIDGTLHILDWNPADTSGAQAEQNPDFTDVTFSSDGHRCMAGRGDHGVIVYDATTGAVIDELLEVDYILDVEFSPGGKHVAIQTQGGFFVWELVTHHTIELCTSEEYQRPVAFSPCGRWLSFSAPGKVVIWDSATHVATDFPGMIANVGIALSLDGCQIACSGFGNERNELYTWMTQDSANIIYLERKMDKTGYTTDIAFSPNGRQIVSSYSDGTVGVWDSNTGCVLCYPLKGCRVGVHSKVAFSPDGCRIYCSSWSVQHQLVWDAHTHANLFLDDIEPHHRRRDRDMSLLQLLVNGWVVDICNKPIFWLPVIYRRSWSGYGSVMLLGAHGGIMLDILDIPL
jgi:WD40 repeat protein